MYDPFMDIEDYNLSSVDGSSPKPARPSVDRNNGSSAKPGAGISSKPPSSCSRCPAQPPIAEPAAASTHASPGGARAGPSSPPPARADAPGQESSKEQTPSARSTISIVVENTDAKGTAFRQSLISQARAHLTRQHLCSLFQLVVLAWDARFVRWDRSGAVVSKRFSFVDEPHLLAEFLWRFGYMTDEQRGRDKPNQRSKTSRKKARPSEIPLYLMSVHTSTDNTAQRSTSSSWSTAGPDSSVGIAPVPL